MKFLNKAIKYVLGLAVLILAGACSGPMDEIIGMNMDRNLSPTDVSLLLIDRTNVQLSWTVTEGIDSYTIEVYADDNLEFDESHLESVIEGILPSQVPYLIENLQGETQYSFRVKAVTDDDPTKDSKWSTAKTTTGTEQIFKAVDPAEIEARSVTLHWTPGQYANQIVLTPGDIVYNVTAEDIENGSATISGLTPETAYTATLKNGEKTRGVVSFTTGVELAEGDILVEEGDDLAAKIAAAPEGSRLILKPGTYTFPGGESAKVGDVTIDKNLAIKGLRPNEMPIINGRFKVEAPFSLDQVVVDGTDTSGDQAFNFTKTGTISSFSITNSEIRNFKKGFLYINVAVVVNTITIDRCLIHDIVCDGGDMFDSRAGGWNDFNLTNSTVYNSCAARDFVRMDNASANVSAAARIKIDHCTLDGISNNAGKRILYVRFTGNSTTFTNNIVSNTVGNFSNQVSTNVPTFSGNYYYKAAGLNVSGENANAKFVDADGKALNTAPYSGSGDFTISDPVLKATAPGDPRWIE